MLSILTIPLIAMAAGLQAQELPTPTAEDLAKLNIEVLLARGDQTREINFKAALIFFTEALRREPENPVALCKRANATQYLTPDISAADYKRAGELFLEALKKDPANAGLRRRILQLADEGRYTKGPISLYEALLEHDPDDVDALFARQVLTIGLVQIDTKPDFRDYERAFGILEGWIRKGAGDEARARAMKAMADMYNPTSYPRASLFLCDRLLRWNPDDVDVLDIRAGLHVYTRDETKDDDKERERIDELYWADVRRALAVVSAGIEKDPKSAALRLQRIRVCRSGDADLRLADATALIEMNPKDPASWILRAGFLEWDNREGRIRDYTKAIELDPDNKVALSQRAIQQHGRGEFEAAIAGFTRALELDPTAGKTYIDRAMSYEALSTKTKDDTLTVKAVVDRLKSWKLGREGSWFNIVFLIEALGRNPDPKAAIDNLTRIIDMDPTCVEACLARAKAYTRCKRVAEALADIEIAIRLKPGDDTLIDRKWDCYRINALTLPGDEPLLEDAREFATRMLAARPKEEPRWLTARGGVLAKLKREAAAMADLDRVVELEPKNTLPLVTRAQTWLQFGNGDRAVADFSKAIDLNPKDLELRWKRADACYGMRADGLAIEDYEAVLKERPDNRKVQERLTKIRTRLKDWEGLIAAATRRIEENPKDPARYMERAKAYEAKKDLASAIGDYSKAMDLAPKNCDYIFARAEAYESMGKMDEALADWDTAAGASKVLDQPRIRSAALRVRRGEYAQAIADYTWLIQKNPKETKFLGKRAECHLALKDADLAFADYSKAVEIDPKDRESWNGRGWISFHRKDVDRALDDFRRAKDLDWSVPAPGIPAVYKARGVENCDAVELEARIAASPPSAGAHYERAVKRLNQKNYDGAVEDYTEALKVRPDWLWCLRGRMVAHEGRKDFLNALVDATRGIELAPKDPDSYKYRARVYWEQGDRDRAMADYQRAVDVAPGSPSARTEMASMKGALIHDKIVTLNDQANGRCKQKDWAGGIALYNKALLLDPGNESTLCNRAYALLHSNDAKEAETQFNAILKANPGSARAKRGIEEVREWTRAPESLHPEGWHPPCPECKGGGIVGGVGSWNYVMFGGGAMERTTWSSTCTACWGSGRM